MSNPNYSNVFCVRFAFGVPLEDIFPPDDIHPKLKNLFDQTYLALSISNRSVIEILKSNTRHGIVECLTLKDDLLRGHLYFKASNPINYLWLIRHFLGLLPLPLFPAFTDGKEFNWQLFAIRCQEIDNMFDFKLDQEIAACISRLPTVNKIFIKHLMLFLRRIARRRDRLDRSDKRAIGHVAKYFSSAMFLRPYRPGNCSPLDFLYLTLTTYLVTGWPRIRKYWNPPAVSNWTPHHKFDYLDQIWKIFKEPKGDKSFPKSEEEVIRRPLLIVKDFSGQTLVETCDKSVETVGNYYFDKKCCCSIGSNYERNYRMTYCKDEDTGLGNHLWETAIEAEFDKSSSVDEASPIMFKSIVCDVETQTDSVTPKRSPRNNFTVNSDTSDYNTPLEKSKLLAEVHKYEEQYNDGFLYDDYDTFESEIYNQILSSTPDKLCTTPSENVGVKVTTSDVKIVENKGSSLFDRVKSRVMLGKKLRESYNSTQKSKKSISVVSLRSRFGTLKEIYRTASGKNIKYKKLMTL